MITMFKCTKIKPKKTTNGNCDGLIFVMCSNTMIEIIEMLRVQITCSNGNGLVTMWNTRHKDKL